MRGRIILIAAVGMLAAFSAGGCRRRAPDAEAEDPTGPAKATAPLVLSVEPAALRVEAGLSAKVKVTLTRHDFAEPVRLEMRNLPPGVTAVPVKLTAEQNSGELELVAAPDAVPIDRRSINVVAIAGERQFPSPSFILSVAKASFAMTFEPAHLKVRKGESRTLKVTLQRMPEAYAGPVEIELANLPKHVKAIPKGKGQGERREFTIQADADAAEASSQVQARVVAEKDLKALALTPLTVQGPPFVMQIDTPTVKLVYGETAQVQISVTRKDYQGPVQVKLENLPIHVKAKPLSLTPTQSSGVIEVQAMPDAVSIDKSVPVRGTTQDNSQVAASFDLKLEGRPFALTAPGGKLDVVQGASAKLKVSAIRAKDFSGPIHLEVRNLPKLCTAATLVLPAQARDGELEIAAADLAALGESAGIQIVGTATVNGAKREVKLDRLVVRVLGPFALQVQPGKIELLEGTKATLKINAERRTYQGPIAVELRNLPEGVTASKAEIPDGAKSIEIEIAASAKAPASLTANTHVLGTTSVNKQIPSGNFTLAVVRKLFELKVQPAVKITFGDKALVKVTAVRQEYQGPIALEIKNLPAELKADKVILPAGKDEIDIEIAAADRAKEGTSDAQVLGTPAAGNIPQKITAGFSVSVQPGLFDLKVEPAVVQLHHGGSAKVKVTALRKGHDGPIQVELRNLPKAIKAEKVMIAKGDTQVEIEIKADATVKEGDRVDVHAHSSVLARQIDSPRFTVGVTSIGQPPLLELKVAPGLVKITPGGSATVKVSAIRKGYKGPIAVELANLPPELKAAKAMIPEGQTTVEVTVTATAKAGPATVTDACAVGSAVEAGGIAFASGHFGVQVGRK